MRRVESASTLIGRGAAAMQESRFVSEVVCRFVSEVVCTSVVRTVAVPRAVSRHAGTPGRKGTT